LLEGEKEEEVGGGSSAGEKKDPSANKEIEKNAERKEKKPISVAFAGEKRVGGGKRS